MTEDGALDIENRSEDNRLIEQEIWRAEVGIRAISTMYDEHSSDKQSKDNIFILKENIKYRLFSAAHQYLVFLRELGTAEQHLKQLHQKDPRRFNGFLFRNPHFEKAEMELSSIFDSIIFHLSSVFDYLSHMMCYICLTDKAKTMIWTKLSMSVRNSSHELNGMKIADAVNQTDRGFVGRLYDYRSRLLHSKRDLHRFTLSVVPGDTYFMVRVLASEVALKEFKLIRNEPKKDGDITLTYLSSWLIKQSLRDIEALLGAVRDEILSNSYFYNNLSNPKQTNGFVIASYEPETRSLHPVSEGMWKEYKARPSCL